VPNVYINIPVIKHWKGSFNYNFTWLRLFPFDGEMDIEIKGLTARAATSFKATKHGRLYP